MKKEEFIKKYTTNTSAIRNVAVHCTTHKQAKRLLRQAKKLGFKWLGYQSKRTFWRKYREETCYILIEYGILLEYDNNPISYKIQVGHIGDLALQGLIIVTYKGETI